MSKLYDPTQAGIIPPRRRVFVPKGWGWEDWIWNDDRYCGKVLFVKQGMECSYHYHKVKDETFLVAEGEILLRYCAEPLGESASPMDIAIDYHHSASVVLRPGDVFHVPPLTRHRFHGMLDSRLIEFSTHHDDADSYRLIRGD